MSAHNTISRPVKRMYPDCCTPQGHLHVYSIVTECITNTKLWRYCMKLLRTTERLCLREINIVKFQALIRWFLCCFCYVLSIRLAALCFNSSLIDLSETTFLESYKLYLSRFNRSVLNISDIYKVLRTGVIYVCL